MLRSQEKGKGEQDPGVLVGVPWAASPVKWAWRVHPSLPRFLSPLLFPTLNPKVSWNRLKKAWRRPKTPLRTSTGGISTLGLQELKEQVRANPTEYAASTSSQD